MSILINGMELPKNCCGCVFSSYTPTGKTPFCKRTGKDLTAEVYFNKRSSDCPLVPVLAHGRLIDADALLMRISHEVMEAYMDGACYGVHPSQEYLYLLCEIIEDAPTIIPAEEGE